MSAVAGVLVLVAVLKLVAELERPFLCAGIYAGAVAILSALRGDGALSWLGATSLSFAYTAAWFWVLTRFEAGSAPWILTLLGGLTMPLAVGTLWRFAL